MTESVYVNAARDKIVEPGPEAAYRIHVKEAKRLGLLKEQPKANKIVESPNGDAPAKRIYTRRATKTDNE
jgi:hypothetical protein